jgi:hypothetical protein
MARTTPAKSAAKPPARTPAKTSAKPVARHRRGPGGAAVTLSIVIVTVMAVAALPLCLLFVGGMLPTVVAAIVDHHSRRYLARTVAATNLVGVLPPALQMWEAGIAFSSLQAVIANPYTWLLMYGAAGVGWLLYFGMPPLVRVLVDLRSEEAKQRLEARAKMLVEEWGEEVTGRKREG